MNSAVITECDVYLVVKYHSFRSLTSKFGVGNATAWRTVHRVVSVIYRYRNVFITWPTHQQATDHATRVENVYEYPGIVGYVDATEIEILPPVLNRVEWINRKKFPSMKLQVFIFSNQIKRHSIVYQQQNKFFLGCIK